MPAIIVGVLVGAYLTTRMPIAIVVPLLLALDIAALLFWFYFGPRRREARALPAATRPLGSLAEVIRVAGVLLIVTALWVTVLGVFTQYGVISAETADWDGLAAAGFQVSPDRPAMFGARSLVVAAAVWVVGFGLAKASGERA